MPFNSDSALTSMTTSVCVDLLKTEEQETKVAIRKRNITHIGLSVLLVICISLVDIMNSPTVIDAIYVIASYTYGPLLGMFAFGLLTKRIANDNTIPYIAIASPILCYLLGIFTSSYWSYTMGYELLMINGLITFLGLYIGSNKSLTKTITL